MTENSRTLSRLMNHHGLASEVAADLVRHAESTAATDADADALADELAAKYWDSHRAPIQARDRDRAALASKRLAAAQRLAHPGEAARRLNLRTDQ